VYCSVAPREIEVFAGVTERETSCGDPTVREVLPETPPIAAVIVTVPVPELVASPWEPVLLLITATVAEELVQVALVVRSFVLWSV
jgi:hypothetical protein